MPDYKTPPPPRSSPVLLTLAWLVVLLPAAWGISQTVVRSLDLFKTPVTSPKPGN